MNNLRISTRLFALLGILVALLLAGGALGIGGLSRSNEGLRSVYESRTVRLGQLDTVQRDFLLIDRTFGHALLERTRASDAEALRKIDTYTAQIEQTWAQYNATALTPREKELSDNYATTYKSYVNDALSPARDELQRGNYDDAQTILLQVMAPLYEKLRENGDALIEQQLEGARGEYVASTERYHLIRLVALTGVLGGSAFAVLFGWAMIGGIKRSLDYAGGISRAIAAGDLTQSVEAKGKDEISQLLHSMGEMRTALQRVVADVRQGVETVTSASAEIAAGNRDLAARTEAQASSLQETAASMDQLTSTVRQTADNARQANELAGAASSAATGGGAIVEQVVHTMDEITAASRKISEIIGVIDGIAFQTNILALNAAVEAARAGEQGRGFAVVAGEVRALAQRSAAAAKEIKDVIGHSVSRVEAGSNLVAAAGTSMNEIRAQVQRVGDLIAEITSASQEQSAGISQVNQTIGQMDQVTQQNAARVEQSAASAAGLQGQAQSLAAAVSVFKLHARA